jgi:hypothetical protein
MGVRRFVAVAVLIIAACTGHKSPSAAPTVLSVESGEFQWNIATTPEHVVHGERVHFSVRARASVALYLSSIDYGDGSGASVQGDTPAGHVPASCTDDTRPTVGGESDDSDVWMHTYSAGGRYAFKVTFASQCVPTQMGTATFSFSVT